MIEDLHELLIEFMGAVCRCAVSDGAGPFCSCCSRDTCLTISLSIWQKAARSYSANTYHTGLITHSVLAVSAPSISPT